MKKLPKVLLASSLIAFVVGFFISFGFVKTSSSWTTIMPLSAVLFGVALIIIVLEKEMALFDEEEMQRMELVRRHKSVASKEISQNSSNKTEQTL